VTYENGVPVTGESGPWVVFDEPAAEDFETDAADEPKAGARAVFVRVLRAVGVLLVIVALLFYFIAPFNSFIRSVPLHWLHPDSGTRPIPLAPRPQHSPKLPA